MTKYNATIHQVYPDDPNAKATFVAHVETINGRPQMLRGNGIQCTGYEGKLLTENIPSLDAKKGDAAYHVYLKHIAKKCGYYFHIVLDDCEGYKNALSGLNLPPAYK